MEITFFSLAVRRVNRHEKVLLDQIIIIIIWIGASVQMKWNKNKILNDTQTHAHTEIC